MNNINFTCPECKSTNVELLIWSKWDSEKQRWEPRGSDDTERFYCNNCEEISGDGEIKYVVTNTIVDKGDVCQTEATRLTQLLNESSEYEINTEMVLSSAHIPANEAMVLEKGEHGMVSSSNEYSWRLYVRHDDDAGMNEVYSGLPTVLKLLHIAKDHGCRWLVLDEAGDQFDTLEIWEW